MRRMLPAVASVLGISALVVLAFGGPARIGLPLPVLLAVALGAILFFQQRRTRTLEVGWSGSQSGITTVADVARAPSTAPRAGRGSVSRSLARVEARELVANPWFGAGVGLWLVILVMFGVLFVEDVERSWWEFFGLATMMCHPFVGLAVVAAHRNRTRSRRDGCDELFDTCPADPGARTLGHLATAWVGSLVCVLFVVGLALLVAARNPRTYGPVDGEALAAVLACAALGAGGIVLGVTLGRWVRWALTPFVVVVCVGFASARISVIGEPAWATDRLLATMVPSSGLDTIFYTRPVWARLAWLVALVVVVAALGLVGSRRTRAPQLIASAAGVVAIIAAVVVVRPAPVQDAARIADLIAEPLAHQTCTEAGSGVRVCAYDDYASLGRRAAAELRPVAAAVPGGMRDDVVFLHLYEDELGKLPAEVRAALNGRAALAPDGALRLRFNANPANFDAARLRLAARAVGLPTEAGNDEVGTVVAGQARGVIVLWLATRGLDRDAAGGLVEETPDEGSGKHDVTDRGAVWPATCNDEVSVLQWSPTDLEAARALLRLPAADVARLLADDWAHLVDPATTTDELLAGAGLDPLGPPERIAARRYTCD